MEARRRAEGAQAEVLTGVVHSFRGGHLMNESVELFESELTHADDRVRLSLRAHQEGSRSRHATKVRERAQAS